MSNVTTTSSTDRHEADLELTPIFAAMCEQFRRYGSFTGGDPSTGSCHGSLDPTAKDEQTADD